MYWRENLETLQNWLNQSRVGLISDLDGTLSHIMPQPDQATVTPQNLSLLTQLNQHLDLVALVSGRAVKDLAERVGLPELTYVGNHGMEHWQEGEIIIAPEIQAFRPQIEKAIHELTPHVIDGMLVEDKQATLSIHYRNTSNPADVGKSFLPIVEQIANDNGLEFFVGRMIFEIRPALKINKGVAFEHLINQHGLTGAIYIGDDTTDVDAFLMAKHLRNTDKCYSLAIGVESSDMPSAVGDNADLMVSGVSDVEALLAWSLNALEASAT